jgi:hypothetical protein
LKYSPFLIGLFFLCATLKTSAGYQDTVRVINFRVIDEITRNPVELAHIINITQKEVAISDLLGYFKIPIEDGDSLTITSLGYFNRVLLCWGQYSDDSIFYNIELKPRTYPLKELKVTWFSTYDKFIKGVSQLKLPLTKEEESTIRITEYFKRTIKQLNLKSLPVSGSGLLFGVDWLTDQNEKLKERLEKERKQRAIERKYSAGIVTALTGLKGNEVHWFMEYCALSEEFILRASDYDIVNRILDKYKIYSIDKTSKEKK